MARPSPAAVGRAQAAYFVASGLWPLVHLPSFEAVTGPKTDDWLVVTVGLLVLGVGVFVGLAARTHPWWAGGLGTTAGSALAFVDVVYVADGTLRAVYLADAAVEGLLLLGWVLALTGRTGDRSEPGRRGIESGPSVEPARRR